MFEALSLVAEEKHFSLCKYAREEKIERRIHFRVREREREKASNV